MLIGLLGLLLCLPLGLAIGIGISPVFGALGGPDAPAGGTALVLEDGTTALVLEDGTTALILE